MFNDYDFTQLAHLPAHRAQKILSEARKEAYSSGSYWAKQILLLILVILIGIFLMQLPPLLNMQNTVVGFLVQSSSILIAVVTYNIIAKRLISKYLTTQLEKHKT